MVTPPRLKRLFIQELFGEDSHDIDISFRLDERVTVLHGLNGSGKTITLNLLYAVWEGWYTRLLDFPLTVMRLEFNNRRVLELRPERTPQENNKRGILATLTRGDELPPMKARLVVDADDHYNIVLTILRENNVSVDRLQRNLYALRGEDSAITHHRLHDIERLYAPLLEKDDRYKNRPNKEPDALRRLRTSLAPALLIRADRLRLRDIHGADPTKRPDRIYDFGSDYRVDHLSHRLQEEVSAARHASQRAALEIDDRVEKRVYALDVDVPSAEALLQRAATLAALEARLKEAGLFDEQSPALPEQIEEFQRPALHNVLQRREAAVRPLEALLNKVQRVLKSLNKKLAPKELHVGSGWGYRVRTPSGRELAVYQLSSGEQHELVLLHELLFELRPGSLILIDEPELSLHVTWQAALLEELLDIAELVGLDFVLATHSPYIIGAHDALMVQLGPSAEAAP